MRRSRLSHRAQSPALWAAVEASSRAGTFERSSPPRGGAFSWAGDGTAGGQGAGGDGGPREVARPHSGGGGCSRASSRSTVAASAAFPGPSASARANVSPASRRRPRPRSTSPSRASEAGSEEPASAARRPCRARACAEAPLPCQR